MNKIISVLLTLGMLFSVTTSAFAVSQASADFKSDTGAKINIGEGKSYQFKITALNGKGPNFAVGGKSFQLQAKSSKGQNYYFIVKAVGKAGSSAGVYINGEKKPSTVITITACKPAKSAFQVDTGTKLTIQPNKTYQFKITSNMPPVVSVGNTSVIEIVSSKSSENTHYFTIRAIGKSGQSAGVYVNGTRVTVCTIGKNGSQIPNPLVSYSTLNAARKAVGFSFAVPTSLPANYKMKDIIVIHKDLAEIFYKKNNKEILYRTAKGNSDISGNNTVYKEVKTVMVGNTKVTTKGKGGLVNLATWTKDGTSFSLDFDDACDPKSVSSIIKSIK